MTLRSAKFRVHVAVAALLLLMPSHGVLAYFNDCGVALRVVDLDSANAPLILKFQGSRQQHVLQIFQPSYLDGDCLVRNLYIGSGLVTFACPPHYLRFPGLKTWPDDVRVTALLGSRQASFDNFTVITAEHPTPIALDRMTGPITCTGPIEPTMKQRADGQYQVGYQLNAIDFLPVFDLTFTDHSSFAHAKVLSINARRPRIDEKNENLRKGQVFKDLPLAASKLGGKGQLSAKVREILKSKLSLANTSADNHLVHGQLLSKDDLFYIPEQRATFFLENTAFIWKSINDGNWKVVGDIVRSLASETVTDLDVYSGTLECLTVDKIPIYPHNLQNASKHTCVPKFLFKIAFDNRFDMKRGIAFVTVNDPNIEIAQNTTLPSDLKLCDKKSECDLLYPEFSIPKRGYTYCCDLHDFALWKEIQSSSVATGMPDVVMPFYGSGIFPPPPPPPGALGPIYAPVP